MELSRLADLVGVRPAVVGTGDFEHGGQLLHLRVREEGAEALAHQSFADVVVPVPVRAERHLRVVHVQRAEPVEADRAVDLLQQGGDRLRGP